MRKMPELLAPAGNRERLDAALHFGADAVYVGAEGMNLRSYADSLGPESLPEACRHVHERGRKLYLACNAFARDEDLRTLPALLEAAAAAGVDALIVNDPGVLRMAKRFAPALPLHLSTQANTLNREAALFWHEQGVGRIILARELSLGQIRAMRNALPDTLELEVFVHGAMCVSYSGRCLLSNYLNGRDSNRGACVQPCRWAYEFREKGTDGLWHALEEDERGSYVFNARDLNLIAHLDKLINAGVDSFKIEGRMKSVAYVAAVSNAYRMALDALRRGEAPDAAIYAELEHTSHRPFTTGFLFPEAVEEAEGLQYTQNAQYQSDMRIAAVVLEVQNGGRRALVRQRNRFFRGERLSILSPGDIGRFCTVLHMQSEAGEARESAPHPNERLWLELDESVCVHDILRLPAGTEAAK